MAPLRERNRSSPAVPGELLARFTPDGGQGRSNESPDDGRVVNRLRVGSPSNRSRGAQAGEARPRKEATLPRQLSPSANIAFWRRTAFAVDAIVMMKQRKAAQCFPFLDKIKILPGSKVS